MAGIALTIVKDFVPKSVIIDASPGPQVGPGDLMMRDKATTTLRRKVDGPCGGCRYPSVAHVCVRLAEADRGICQREPRYRRDPRLKTQRMQLTTADLQVLRRSPLLDGIADHDLDRLIAQGRMRALHRGETLFHQGDPARALFVVLEGCLKIHRTTREGVVTVRRISGPGDSVAEAAAFLGGRYPAAAEAVWDTRLLEISAETLFAFFATTPALAKAVARLLSHRLERQMQDLENAYWCSAPQRLAAFLAEMFPADAVEVDIRLPFDKNTLAARLGMTPETLSRAFLALKERGVRTHNRCVYVQNVARLRQFAAIDESFIR